MKLLSMDGPNLPFDYLVRCCGAKSQSRCSLQMFDIGFGHGLERGQSVNSLHERQGLLSENTLPKTGGFRP
ncbi:MAG: hypothetical protein ACFB11_02690 [Paracoccaceae bacterium]